jgi:hypothetical protein
MALLVAISEDDIRLIGGHNQVMDAIRKLRLVKWLTRLAFVGWLTAILLAGLADPPIREFWSKVELPLGMLLYGLWIVRNPTKRYKYFLGILLITFYVYRQALPQRDAFDVAMFAVYALLSGAIAVYVLYRIYKFVEKAD